MDKEYVKITPSRYNSLLEADLRLNLVKAHIADADMRYLNAEYNTHHELSLCADSEIRDIIGYEMPDEVFNLRDKLIKEDKEKVINADN